MSQASKNIAKPIKEKKISRVEEKNMSDSLTNFLVIGLHLTVNGTSI